MENVLKRKMTNPQSQVERVLLCELVSRCPPIRTMLSGQRFEIVSIAPSKPIKISKNLFSGISTVNRRTMMTKKAPTNVERNHEIKLKRSQVLRNEWIGKLNDRLI